MAMCTISLHSNPGHIMETSTVSGKTAFEDRQVQLNMKIFHAAHFEAIASN
jgi:hypothetical protein